MKTLKSNVIIGLILACLSFQATNAIELSGIPNKIKSMVSGIMTPKRVAQCIFASKKYNCSDKEKKEAKIWLAVATTATITTITLAAAAITRMTYKNAQDKVLAEQNKATTDLEVTKLQMTALNLHFMQLLSAYVKYKQNPENLKDIADFRLKFEAGFSVVNNNKIAFAEELQKAIDQTNTPATLNDIARAFNEAEETENKSILRTQALQWLILEYLKFKDGESSEFKSKYAQALELYDNNAKLFNQNLEDVITSTPALQGRASVADINRAYYR